MDLPFRNEREVQRPATLEPFDNGRIPLSACTSAACAGSCSAHQRRAQCERWSQPRVVMESR